MRINISCNYCECSDKRTYYMLTLTSFTDRSNSCTKVICDKCAARLGDILESILDKRDIDAALRDIENDLLEE